MAMPKGGGGRGKRRKVCHFCADKIAYIDYKDVVRLRRYLTDRGKILARRVTGTCASHQRALTDAIQRARIIALLPFSGLIESDRPVGPRDRDGRHAGAGGRHHQMANAVPQEAREVAPAPMASLEA